MNQLISELAGKFGMQSDQVEQGAGAVLNMIKEKASTEQFQSLLDKVPGASEWVGKAQNLSAGAGDSAEGMMGAVGGLMNKFGADGIGGLVSQLGSAGFKPETAMQFLPELLEKLKGQASPELINGILSKIPALQTLLGGQTATEGLGGLGGKLTGMLGGLFKK